MPTTAIKGVYRKGEIIPMEEIPYQEDMSVVIVFLREEKVEPEKPNAWEKIKQKIAEKHPDLLTQTKEEAIEEFERLSKKVADNMPYKTLGYRLWVSISLV